MASQYCRTCINGLVFQVAVILLSMPPTVCVLARLESFNVVAWYDLRSQYVAAVPPTAIDYSSLSHLVVGKPNITVDGRIECTPYSMDGNVTSQLRQMATANGVKMQWVISDMTMALVNNTKAAANFMAMLPEAAKRCECDGIEFDFEPGTKATKAMIETYTDFLETLKLNMGENFTISADVAAWTDIPYITPEKMIHIDFVNLMSYFFDRDGSIQQYKDALLKLKLWGFKNSQINVGIPYYVSSQSAWADLSPKCPNADPDANTCGGDNVQFVGKNMNFRLGQLVQEEKYAGIFPWQFNYDTVKDHNRLFPFLLKGLTGPTPPPTPPPTPSVHTPIYVPAIAPYYIYKSRDEAAAGCKKAGYSHLCAKVDLVNHSLCKAGWTSDWEGYWMATAETGCGTKGFSSWSGDAGAFCCK